MALLPSSSLEILPMRAVTVIVGGLYFWNVVPAFAFVPASVFALVALLNFLAAVVDVPPPWIDGPHAYWCGCGWVRPQQTTLHMTPHHSFLVVLLYC
jgi:hypothetical protein